MSAEHKQALAEGRRLSRVVKRYLEHLGARPRQAKRGRAELVAEMERVAQALENEDNVVKALSLRQARIDLRNELEVVEGLPEAAELESRFVEVAAEYSERKGISFQAWREAGVPAAVLRRAGLGRRR